MAYQHGIETCIKALELLSSDNIVEKRLNSAFTEITELAGNDTSLEHFRATIEWCEKYLSITKRQQHNGLLKKTGKELSNLSTDLAHLCTNIIEYNARNLSM